MRERETRFRSLGAAVTNTELLLLSLFVAAAMVACGDDGDDPDTEPDVTEVPEEVEAEVEVEQEVEVEIDTYDPFGDSDGDGLADYLEDINGNGQLDVGETDPRNPDTDNDGLPDGLEDANHNGFYDFGETDPLNADSDGDTLLDGVEDANQNGTRDAGETDPLSADSDGDGIGDDIEIASGTLDPNKADTDGDNLPDGLEDTDKDGVFDPEEGETNPASSDTDNDNLNDGCEDRNANGTVDEGETDPRAADSDADSIVDGAECIRLPAGACPNFDNVGNCPTDPTRIDTDGDGLNDFTELTSDYGGGISTDPRNPDTDGDNVPDGLEDFNQNGAYDPSLGELNPIDPITDGMTPDGQRPQAQACIGDDLPPIVSSPNADLQFAYRSEFTATQVGVPATAAPVVAVWAFDSAAMPVHGFVLSKRPATGAKTALDQEAADAGSIGGTPVFPRAFTTWDGLDARLTQYQFSESQNSTALRNRTIARLLGLTESALTGLPTGGGQSGSKFELSVLTVFRSDDQVVIIGAVLPTDTAPTDLMRVLALSFTDATGLAKSQDHFALNADGENQKACNIFRVTELPIVDYLFIVDDTASMDPGQYRLAEANAEIFAAVQSSFVSARWTIASTEVGTDTGYDGAVNHCGLLSSPKGPNGIIWAPFTTAYQDAFACRVRDPLGNQNCDPTFSGQPGYAEYGLTCSRFAINYFQGRRGTPRPEDLQRPRSELIVVIFTDENEDLSTDDGAEMNTAMKAEMLAFLGVTSWSALTPQGIADKFINFYKTVASSPPYGAATPFVVYNKSSSYEREVYFEFIDKNPTTFPNGGSMDILQPTQIPDFVQKIIRASTGLASTFEPVHVPITANMRCVVQRAFTTDAIPLNHSLSNGWNYDPAADSMVFYGEDRPRLLDSFAIAYLYWVSP